MVNEIPNERETCSLRFSRENTLREKKPGRKVQTKTRRPVEKN